MRLVCDEILRLQGKTWCPLDSGWAEVKWATVKALSVSFFSQQTSLFPVHAKTKNDMLQ